MDWTKPKNINDTLTLAKTNTVSVISHTDCERDLGIFIDSGLIFHQHTDLIANKASRLVGLIRRSFRHLDTKTFTRLYKALV